MLNNYYILISQKNPISWKWPAQSSIRIQPGLGDEKVFMTGNRARRLYQLRTNNWPELSDHSPARSAKASPCGGTTVTLRRRFVKTHNGRVMALSNVLGDVGAKLARKSCDTM
jgi:hypothetical protein